MKQRVYSNVADRYLATAEDLFIPARGVPQGNPLSPLEFSYGINDPLKEAGKLVGNWKYKGSWKHEDTEHKFELNIPKVTAYLDDIAVTASSLEELHEVFTLLRERMADIGLHFNPEKCKVLHLHKYGPAAPRQLEGAKFVTCAKLMGVWISETDEEADEMMQKLFEQNLKETKKLKKMLGLEHFYVYLRNSILKREAYARENTPVNWEEVKKHDAEYSTIIAEAFELHNLPKSQIPLAVNQGGLVCSVPSQHTVAGTRRAVRRVLLNKQGWIKGSVPAFLMTIDDKARQQMKSLRERLELDLETTKKSITKSVEAIAEGLRKNQAALRKDTEETLTAIMESEHATDEQKESAKTQLITLRGNATKRNVMNYLLLKHPFVGDRTEPVTAERWAVFLSGLASHFGTKISGTPDSSTLTEHVQTVEKRQVGHDAMVRCVKESLRKVKGLKVAAESNFYTKNMGYKPDVLVYAPDESTGVQGIDVVIRDMAYTRSSQISITRRAEAEKMKKKQEKGIARAIEQGVNPSVTIQSQLETVFYTTSDKGYCHQSTPSPPPPILLTPPALISGPNPSVASTSTPHNTQTPKKRGRKKKRIRCDLSQEDIETTQSKNRPTRNKLPSIIEQKDKENSKFLKTARKRRKPKPPLQEILEDKPAEEMAAMIPIPPSVPRNIRSFSRGVIPVSKRRTISVSPDLVQTSDQETEPTTPSKKRSLALLDFSNAFNSVSVEAVLAAVNRLKVSSTIKNALLTYLQSIQIVHDGKAFALLRGLCQGDALSSLLFAVIIHHLVEKLHKDWGMLKLKTNESVEDSPTIVELPRTTSYLDDISVIVDSEDDYKKLLSFVEVNAIQFGLELNADKSKCLPLHKTPGVEHIVKFMGISLSNCDKLMRRAAKDELNDIHANAIKGKKGFDLQNFLEVMRTVVLPRYSHQVLFAPVKESFLKNLDKGIASLFKDMIEIPVVSTTRMSLPFKHAGLNMKLPGADLLRIRLIGLAHFINDTRHIFPQGAGAFLKDVAEDSPYFLR
ncbi:hypothetical protein ADUPG1_007657, partial [Aduncisulcus paluster]